MPKKNHDTCYCFKEAPHRSFSSSATCSAAAHIISSKHTQEAFQNMLDVNCSACFKDNLTLNLFSCFFAPTFRAPSSSSYFLICAWNAKANLSIKRPVHDHKTTHLFQLTSLSPHNFIRATFFPFPLSSFFFFLPFAVKVCLTTSNVA